MKRKIFVLLSFGLIVNVCGRGPHHPRGEPIVKRHVHYSPSKDNQQKITQDAELLHDKEHIQEHLEELINEPDLSNLTDEELEFYYFQVHDNDKNSKLDGLELLQAIAHTKHDDEHFENDEHDTQVSDSVNQIADFHEDFNYIVELIDRVLLEDDSDNDGYISYPEYVAGRKNSKNYNGYTKLS